MACRGLAAARPVARATPDPASAATAASPNVAKTARRPTARRPIVLITTSPGAAIDFLARAKLACFDGRVWSLDTGIFRCGLCNFC